MNLVAAIKHEIALRRQSALILRSPAPERLSRQRMNEWARSFGNDQTWVCDTFTFDPDGKITAPGKVYLFGKKIEELPEGIDEIKGGLNLANSTFRKLETLPQKIGGNLELTNTPISSLDKLPEGMEIGGGLYLYNAKNLGSLEGLKNMARIGKDLIISSIPEKSIPAGVPVGGVVWILKSQTQLLADAMAKGYRVRAY